MKPEKFELLQECLDCGKYAVDVYKGKIYHKFKENWKELTPYILPNGYQQVELYAGRGLGIRVKMYVHQIVWYVANGPFKGAILHRNDISDNSLQNLTLRHIKPLVKRKPTAGNCNVVRGEDIRWIESYISRGYTTAQICSRLDLRPETVRRTVKLIKENHRFTHTKVPAPVVYLAKETSKPQTSFLPVLKKV